jgi:hypothetical protein
MKDLKNVPYNPIAEKIVDVLCLKTQNSDRSFYRISVGYFLCKVAASMRCNIKTHDRGIIPVNMYAINLAASGYGKGHSTNIIEDYIINQFRERFMNETFPLVAQKEIEKLAIKRAAKDSIDEDKALEKVHKEYYGQGTEVFDFDSATPAAIKQVRHKFLMAGAGSINMQIDEIGSNLIESQDAFKVFLELYDVGKVKQKITKNTSENVRAEEINGRTPTNCLMYGTPAKLLDGGKVEQEMISMFDTGYARRSFFGFARDMPPESQLSPEERYDLLTDGTCDAYFAQLSDDFGELADIDNFGVTLLMSKETSILIMEYQDFCCKRARLMPEHKQIQQAEMTHRYFKSLKLAGAYAFIEGSHEVTSDHFYAAVRLAEDSGIALENILKREQNYVKLAKYVCSLDREVTHADLTEELPFYKGNAGFKADMLTLAIAYGYRNNLVIKKSYLDGIEFLSGDKLADTNLNSITISYSNHAAYRYSDGYNADGSVEECAFEDIGNLTQLDDMHWTTHHFLDDHRCGENVIAGFDLLVLDVDEGVDIATVRLLMSDYAYHIHTTKRHQTYDKEKNIQYGDRFRVVLPLNYHLSLSEEDYHEFMMNIAEGLPFEIDHSTFQRSKKWLTHDGTTYDNEGMLFDALPFIPKTTKNEARQQVIVDQKSLNNMERWFMNNTGTGNRSNQLVKFALMYVDAGRSITEVTDAVLDLNAKLPEPMKDAEIMATIMVSAGKAIKKRDGL